jgi:RimJ/RimL family protein N-acetyltransferase
LISEFIIDTKTGMPMGVPVTSGAAKPPEPVVLTGEHIIIVPFDIDKHSASLFDIENKEQLYAYLPIGPFKTLDEQIASHQAMMMRPDQMLYALLDPKSGDVLGHAAYLRIDPANASIEVGNILFSNKLQRTPAATEAMYLMAKYAFESLGYRRYEWKCNNLNAPSKRAALRFGFTFEGVFRQAAIVKGHNRDTAWYSMLDSEWQTNKQGFEAWLNPDNFDETGKQRKSLSEF